MQRRRIAIAVAFLALVSCGGPSPSIFDPQGPQASQLTFPGVLMMAIGGIAFAIVSAMLLLAMFSKRRADPNDPSGRRVERRVIFVGGILFPAAVALTFMGYTIRTSDRFLALRSADELRVDVIGKQYWWDVRYPQLDVATANEIHIPVGRVIHLRLTTEDVIHSFWVPQLAGKVDMVPGKVNEMTIRADRAGVYRGQCAEYCGIQHARMAFLVIADAPARFDEWASRVALPAPAAVAAAEQRGLSAFLANCAACHTIRGTPAGGDIGPDLTWFGRRLSIGAGQLPNNRGNLAGWISNAQSIKPGSFMPPINLLPAELQALLVYLEGQR
jgi:cytochrome c oxidase subunit II